MEARRNTLAEQSQRRIAIGTVAQITQNLVEGAVFLHDVDNVLDLPVEEVHDVRIFIEVLAPVAVVSSYLRSQIPEIVLVRNPSADQRRVFKLKLILIVRSELFGLIRIGFRRVNLSELNHGHVAVTIAGVRTRVALSVHDIHPASVLAESYVGRVVCGRQKADGS